MNHLLIALWLMQQHPADKPEFTWHLTTAYLAIPKYAEAKEETDKGTYRWIFEDPNNEYRCYVTARLENGTFTVVCVRPRQVKEKAAPTEEKTK